MWVSILASLATFFAYRFFGRKTIRTLFLYIDGFAVAMFAVQATVKVWRLEFGLPIAPVIMGVITAIGGGLIRDVLAGRPTLLMSRELYAIPVLLGCILYNLILIYAPEHHFFGSVICVIVIFGIRAAAIRWDLHVPDWATLGITKR